MLWSYYHWIFSLWFHDFWNWLNFVNHLISNRLQSKARFREDQARRIVAYRKFFVLRKLSINQNRFRAWGFHRFFVIFPTPGRKMILLFRTAVFTRRFHATRSNLTLNTPQANSHLLPFKNFVWRVFFVQDRIQPDFLRKNLILTSVYAHLAFLHAKLSYSFFGLTFRLYPIYTGFFSENRYFRFKKIRQFEKFRENG